jgi:hypothetical protein
MELKEYDVTVRLTLSIPVAARDEQDAVNEAVDRIHRHINDGNYIVEEVEDYGVQEIVR